MARKLNLSEEEILRRKTYLNFSSQEEQSLRLLVPAFREKTPEFVLLLHDRINAFPETRKVLEATHSQAWLKARHAEYFIELVSGVYDMDYVLNRLGVGLVHQRIGLAPQWVQASFGLFLEWANSLLRSGSPSLANIPASLSDSLAKITLFDSGLVMDSYFMAERERTEILSRVFETNAEAVWILDDRWVIRHANQTTRKITGLEPEPLSGRLVSEFISDGAGVPEFSPESMSLMAKEQGHWEGELSIRHQDGRDISVWATLNIADSQEDAPINYILEFRDRTTEQKTEKELLQKTADLLRSNRDLEQFAYVASHDLQEPLRMVTSYTQLLARRYKGQLSEEADDFIRFAVDGAIRMQALINALLSYSRVDTRGKPFVPCDTGVVIGHALENLKVAISESGAVFEFSSLPTVIGDPVQLMQLFQNLIGNAIKFRSPDRPPKIRVSALESGDVWLFSVEDNGIGIDPQFYERIFVIFQRLHTKEEYPGTGIGLAMCKRIVERHGGSIGVSSHPKEGAVFSFTLRGVDKNPGSSSPPTAHS
jgi:PAS domain S-box-containing protein